MTDRDSLQAIEARRRELADEIAKIQAEDEELAVAERVLRRLAGTEGAKASVSIGAPRPSGAPKTFEMVDMVLASAEKEGKDGLHTPELVEAIRKRYWPGLVAQQIMPMVYQMARDGRFHKTPGGKFKRLKPFVVGNHEPEKV
jgi:hypothetical protein